MSLKDYSPCELEPRKLSKEEIENPYLVIHDFFSFAHLPSIRNHLWEWLKLTVTGDYQSYSRKEKANIVYFYEKITQLIEANHVIHQRTKKRPSQ